MWMKFLAPTPSGPSVCSGETSLISTSRAQCPSRGISLYTIRVEIRPSALKHGCLPEDVLHAITHALVAYDDLDDPFILYLGPDITGTLLEVMTAVDDQGEETVFHAMPMRRKYRRLLP